MGVAGVLALVAAVTAGGGVALRASGDATSQASDPGDAHDPGDEAAAVDLPAGPDELRPRTGATSSPASSDEDGSHVTCRVDHCLAWEHRSPIVLGTWQGVVVTEGMVVTAELVGASTLVTSDGETTRTPPTLRLTGLEAATGRQRWRAQLPAPEDGPNANLVAADGQVMVIDGEATMWSFDAEQGRVRWAKPLAGELVGQARRVGDDLLVVTVTSSDPETRSEVVSALDPSSGAVRWTADRAPRVVLTASGPVTFGVRDGLALLDPVDGSRRWQRDLGQGAVPLALAVGDLLVTVGAEGTLVIDARDGEVLHAMAADPSGAWPGSPAGDDEGVALPGDGMLTVVDASGRSWTRSIEGCCQGASVDGDAVTVLLRDGSVHRLDRADGAYRARWSPPPRSTTAGRPVQLVGPFALARPEDAGPRELVVRDAGSGGILAEVEGAYPAGVTGQGQLIMVGSGRIAAIRPAPRSGP